MSTPSAASEPTVTISLDLDWRWHRPKRRPTLPKGEPRDDERPIRCIAGTQVQTATTTSLPYPDASLDHVDCGTVFAYVRNDEGLARELVRVVRPGGKVTIQVPAHGPIGGLDAFNLHRYLVDITKRGLRPFETADIGWRRHYAEEDIVRMLGEDKFTQLRCSRSGIAAAEVVRMSGFVLFRWLRPSRDRYRAVSGTANRIQARERNLRWKHGFWLDMEMERTEN